MMNSHVSGLIVLSGNNRVMKNFERPREGKILIFHKAVQDNCIVVNTSFWALELIIMSGWRFYSLSASKAISRARTYSQNLFSPVMMITYHRDTMPYSFR